VLSRFENSARCSAPVTRDIRTPPATSARQGTGWGGGLALADMDLDGFPEIAFGDTVWTTTGTRSHVDSWEARDPEGVYPRRRATPR